MPSGKVWNPSSYGLDSITIFLLQLLYDEYKGIGMTLFHKKYISVTDHI